MWTIVLATRTFHVFSVSAPSLTTSNLSYCALHSDCSGTVIEGLFHPSSPFEIASLGELLMLSNVLLPSLPSSSLNSLLMSQRLVVRRLFFYVLQVGSSLLPARACGSQAVVRPPEEETRPVSAAVSQTLWASIPPASLCASKFMHTPETSWKDHPPTRGRQTVWLRPAVLSSLSHGSSGFEGRWPKNLGGSELPTGGSASLLGAGCAHLAGGAFLLGQLSTFSSTDLTLQSRWFSLGIDMNLACPWYLNSTTLMIATFSCNSSFSWSTPCARQRGLALNHASLTIFDCLPSSRRCGRPQNPLQPLFIWPFAEFSTRTLTERVTLTVVAQIWCAWADRVSVS